VLVLPDFRRCGGILGSVNLGNVWVPKWIPELPHYITATSSAVLGLKHWAYCGKCNVLNISTFYYQFCGKNIRYFTGVTILLALSVYQIIVNEKLPASSDEVPVIGIIFAVLET